MLALAGNSSRGPRCHLNCGCVFWIPTAFALHVKLKFALHVKLKFASRYHPIRAASALGGRPKAFGTDTSQKSVGSLDLFMGERLDSTAPPLPHAFRFSLLRETALVILVSGSDTLMFSRGAMNPSTNHHLLRACVA